MSIVEKAFANAQLTLGENNALPPGQRTVKVFQQVIKALRAAEADVLDREAANSVAWNNAERERNTALQTMMKLQDKVKQLENELRAFRAKEWAATVDALSTGDRTRLLEVVSPGT